MAAAAPVAATQGATATSGVAAATPPAIALSRAGYLFVFCVQGELS